MSVGEYVAYATHGMMSLFFLFLLEKKVIWGRHGCITYI